ncbi:MCE family protein [Rhodococcus sp. HNM0569]|uniref:MCE family protein n=1 Tax=Rhodococcus sp. HNM0569 TaxID=2716340 RepID=UPI00146ED9B1|nr:MCE family protein [Rhodococcus sp. HNM0569]NLU83305.1 MCE family protein [Rhodococcus sp. HNM0569]
MTTEHAGRSTRRTVVLAIAAVVLIVAIAGVWRYVVPALRFYTLTADFPSTIGVYEGDDVRIAGVKVGTVRSIEPGVDGSEVTLELDRSVSVPADAKAAVVATSLVASRYVQLAPAYRGEGPVMRGDGHFPRERTAVPIEWDKITAELERLTTALGPDGADSQGSLSRFVDSASGALSGEGERFHTTITELSRTMKLLSESSPDIFASVENLQTFTAALSSSTQQIENFQRRLSEVSGTLADSSDTLGRSLADLDIALGDVESFVGDNRGALTEQVGRLADATSVLVEHRSTLERVMHIAPTALDNYYNIYSPLQGTFAGVAATQNTGNPVNFICGAIAGLANATAEQGADLCAQYLGPILGNLAMNYPPISSGAFTGVRATPDDLVYSDPALAPGGSMQDAGAMDLPESTPVTVPGGLAELLGGGR